MKKLILLVFPLVFATFTIFAACLTACSNSESSLIAEYVNDIKAQLEINIDYDYCYTYQKAEPRSNNAYIIDFYVFDYTNDYTKWLCIKEGNEIECDLLFVKHF